MISSRIPQKIRILSAKGTTSYFVNYSSNNWIHTKKSDVIKIISTNPSGQKLTTMHGTDSFWLIEQPKYDICINPKKITLLVEKGTRKITHILDQFFSMEKTTKNYSTEKLVCDTCKEEITSDICRFLVMYDKDGGPCLLSFHFFFPCWNFEDLCQKYPNLTLERAGFTVPENISMHEKSIKDLQNNLSFWY